MRDNPMTSRRTRIGLAAALALLWTGAGANAKELHWRAIEVAARLESDGTLAVSEVQRMVFTGDWNGGERKFRLAAGQTLTLDRMVRLEPGSDTGTELRRGSLDEVDHYDLAAADTVRWRSRLPSDPEFDGTDLGYRLDYRITGALRQTGERSYQLDHQFAFTDRDGVIERLVVRLTLGPAEQPREVALERAAILPGPP